ncbi:MAG: zinc ABC transporter ATP-binding protein [Candidatus Improbicoccus devescovinae]|nr:MAG: zinc ABC transporter ATP-binding protein [Candidatus Improbicoccus devescovinae]
MTQKKCQCSIKIKNLSVKISNKYILNRISFSAYHGEILAIIGTNGAGKTTLVKTILNRTNLIGEIIFFDSTGKKIFNPKIGYVPQGLVFDKNIPMTVLDFFSLNLTNLPCWIGYKRTIITKINHILEKFNCENLIHKSLGNLSGGELQKVLLIFALEPKPDILILDEPSSGLDQRGIDAFYSLLTLMRNTHHMPILLVSHDLAKIKKYATKYLILNYGTILETGCVSELNISKIALNLFGL